MAEKKAFAAIEVIEAQMEATHAKRQQVQEELLVEHLRAREPLLQRRYELVAGRSEPTEEELQGFTPQGAALAAPAASSSPGAGPHSPAASSAGGGKGAGKARGDGGGGGRRGVPFFWLNVLCNQETTGPLITSRDRHALEYCEDVRFCRGPAGMVVELHFAANPYFENKVLRKGIYLKRAAAPAGGSGSGGPMGQLGDIEDLREEATVIDWKPGRCLLVRQEAAAGTGGRQQAQGARGKGKGGQVVGAGEGGGGGKKGRKQKGEAAPSRAKRHHGKRGGGPAPDLPDPEDEEDEEEEAEEEEEEAAEGGAARAGGRAVPCPSFFRFFLPIAGGKMRTQREIDPTAEAAEDESEEDEDDSEGGEAGEEDGEAGEAAARARAERRALDGRVLDALVKAVVPRAVHLYCAKARPGQHQDAAAEGAGTEAAEEGFEMVSGAPPGDLACLSLSTQRALHALQGLQSRLDALGAALKEGEWRALVGQAEEVAALGAKRRALLMGAAPAKGASGSPPRHTAVPCFWLRALRAAPAASSLIARRDEAALSYLADVRLAWDTARMPTPELPSRAATLELEFLPSCPYFAPPAAAPAAEGAPVVLRRRFTFHAPGGSLTKLGVEAAVAEPVPWAPGRDLTARTGADGRARAAPSLFHLFGSTPAALARAFSVPGNPASRAAQAEAAQAQEELIGELANAIVYFAGRLARETPVDVSDLGDEREDEEDEEESEEEEDEEDEDGDADAAADRRAAAAARRAARRRAGGAAADDGGGAGDGLRGWLLSLTRLSGPGAALLALLVALMAVAQALLFVDTLDYVRAKFGLV